MEIDTETNEKIYNLLLKGQNDRKIEIQIETKSTLGDLLQRIDDLTKDRESWTHYTVGNTRLILNGASMENALITDKYDMATTLENTIGLTNGSALTLAQGQPNRNRRREEPANSPAYTNLAQFRTLVRNVRVRYDHPEEFESLPSQPSKYRRNLWPIKKFIDTHGHWPMISFLSKFLS